MRTALACLALIFVAGCSSGTNGAGGGSGGSTGGGSGGGSALIPIAQLCSTIAGAECDFLVRCGAYESKATCVTEATANTNLFSALAITPLPVMRPCQPAPFANADAGLYRYDSAQAAACVAGFQTASCKTIPAACGTIFAGALALDAGCGASDQCGPNAYCQYSATSVCGGRCEPRIAVGQPVTSGQECIDGSSDVAHLCTPKVPIGTSCKQPDGGPFYLTCLGGGNCTLFFLADGGYSNVCSGYTADAGESCLDPAAGVAGCGPFTVCDDATKRCVPLHAEDGGCSPTNFGLQCKFDLWCNGGLAAPTCQAHSALGGACAYDESCASGVCDGGSYFNPGGGLWTLGACLPLPGANAACGSQQCAQGLYCESQVCAPRKVDGEPCGSDNSCASGKCSYNNGMFVCGPCR